MNWETITPVRLPIIALIDPNSGIKKPSNDMATTCKVLVQKRYESVTNNLFSFLFAFDSIISKQGSRRRGKEPSKVKIIVIEIMINAIPFLGRFRMIAS